MLQRRKAILEMGLTFGRLTKMSLYDGLENDGKEDRKPASWDANLKLLQSHIQLKKAALTQQRDKTRVPATPGTSSIEMSKKRSETKAIVVAEAIYSSPKERLALFEDLQVQDEYNPLYPNDYEKIAKRRDDERQKKKEEEKKRASEDREKRRKDRHEHETRRSDEEEEDEEKRDWRRERDKRTGGAAIAPPPSLTASDTSGRTDERESAGGGFAKPFGSASKGLNVAAKIMEKYGYRQGGGLGKKEQGMSTALQVEKTGLRGGKIIHEKDAPKDLFMPPSSYATDNSFPISNTPSDQGDDGGPAITDLLKNPTKVVLLRNMIGPGEVDDDLDGEIREEMSKYGDVTNVLIFEIPEAGPEEAVRIFVEYPKIDQAIKALVGLNGRFFGGKNIRATFYNYDKYKKFELGD